MDLFLGSLACFIDLSVCLCASTIYFWLLQHCSIALSWELESSSSVLPQDCSSFLGSFLFPSAQFSSLTQSRMTLCNPVDCSTPSFLSITNSWSILKLKCIALVVPSNHLILCHPFLLLPSVFPSIKVFSKESVLRIRWSKYWSFSFSISPANEYSGLISFRIDWFHHLAVQGTLKSLLQHHSSKASVLQCSAFFIV